MSSTDKVKTRLNALDERKRGLSHARDIIAAVCHYYSVSVEQVAGKGRSASIILPRYVAMYLSRTETKLSLEEIGYVFNRDHTTVLHAIRTIEDQRQRNETLVSQMNTIKKEIEISGNSTLSI